MSPLSLAYMIEISFVVNLAYHELETFKLRDKIRERASIVGQSFKGMWKENDEALVNPEWSYLKEFHTGENKYAWEGKWRCHFYQNLIRSCVDRYIARGFMIADIVILFIATLSANTPITLSAEELGLPETFWWIGFSILFISIVVPPIFVIFIRMCERYVFGCVEEDPFNQEDLDASNSGRINKLQQKVLLKATKMATILRSGD